MLQIFESLQQQSEKNVIVSQSNIQQPVQQSVTITGVVVDEQGKALAGVTVTLKSNLKQGTVTDQNGRFSIAVPRGSEILLITCVGMQDQEIALRQGVTVYNIRMTYSKKVIEEVLISTGMFLRDKTSFTGSVASYSQTELKQVSSRNVLHSLSILDPSFTIIDNVDMGSNPNTMPTIEVRGQGSATLRAVQDEFSIDPNQPLFVLNGVVVSIQRINDLDMNRVESITILKDAGSTAIYGARGANGVVVIETVKPKVGEYKVYYRGNFALDGPDLTVYNMMNSAEKLEFERLAGYYGNTTAGNLEIYHLAHKAKLQLYNDRLADIRRGVDTYWLSEPVRTSLSQGHSLRIAGGSEELSVEVGGNFKNTQGVMKGSERNTWGGVIMLAYRANKLTISNDLDLTGYIATESPYGDFSNWVNASPYYTKETINEDGTPRKWLQPKIVVGSDAIGRITVVDNIPNPMWNASLKSFDETNNFNVANSTFLQYQFSDQFQVKGGVDYSRIHQHAVSFLDREHTNFFDRPESEKGTRTDSEFKNVSYSGYLQGNYGQTFNDIHTISANARISISQAETTSLTNRYRGFPRGSTGSANQGQYIPETSPGNYQLKKREVGSFFSANYNYLRRYLLDFSARYDGSTTFGSNRLFQPFWSVGIGWNVNNELFAENWDNIDILKIRASIGSSGNQNIGRVTSSSVYQTYLDSHILGQGFFISSLGAPNLPWQVTQTVNVGLDFRTYKGRLSLTVDAYRKLTDPLIINIPQIPSTGLKDYPMHMGKLTSKGVEWAAAFSPIYNLEERFIWTIRVTGQHVFGKYSGFGEKLAEMSKTMSSSADIHQYADGFSPSDIWAVRSAGIDPITGREIFITMDDQLTFVYNSKDKVVVGNTRPDLQGHISTTLTYKNFSMLVAMEYSFGSDIYNYDLFNKVENITETAILYNQDKRALYDRWKRVGDISAFKSISIVSSESNKTSRFIQKNNYLRASSINLTYDINQNPWLKRNLGMEMVQLSFTVNDLFRLETSKTERGITYPFARTFALSMSLNF